MENPDCVICGSSRKRGLFKKASGGDLFQLVKCADCGLEFVSPRPGPDEIISYYNNDYFKKRTDRGYDNYFSTEVKNEIIRVIELNLKDLGFPAFEKACRLKRALDIGCAAGYFTGYLAGRGWEASGIDISGDCVEHARNSGLNVILGDYISTAYPDSFDLVTLWASIEHLHYPDRFLEKIRLELDKDGILYLSTCRSGMYNFKTLHGENWRYYNFPEHLYFFSRRHIKKILENHGFEMILYRTYGSGTGRPGSALRRISDYAAKFLYLGDMMLVAAKKRV